MGSRLGVLRQLPWLSFCKPVTPFKTKAEIELFSDNFSKAETVSRLVKARLLQLAIGFLRCEVLNLLWVFI